MNHIGMRERLDLRRSIDIARYGNARIIMKVAALANICKLKSVVECSMMLIMPIVVLNPIARIRVSLLEICTRIAVMNT